MYGADSVFQSTGFHPFSDFKVMPFNPTLEMLANRIQSITGININSLEIKIYQGRDIFEEEPGKPWIKDSGENVNVNCNRCVGEHNDLVFRLDGTQSPKDTACGDENIATFTIGSTRQLTFSRFKSRRNDQWSREEASEEIIDLRHGTLFVFSRDDEIPKPENDGFYHKTKHRANFKGDGLSFAFVFRRVETYSYFHEDTNLWCWEMDEKYLEKAPRIADRIETAIEKVGAVQPSGTVPKEVEGMRSNVEKFVQKLR